MTFRQFALHNVLRNKRLYLAYFLSSAFTVMVFFTFAMFAFHPTFSSGTINKNALFGMSVAGGIIYIFSFFFVLYSMSSFLQSRKREFGLLTLLGMSTRQIRWMVFLENMLIGLFATLSGIGLGLIFAKVILLIAENALIIEQSLNFYMPTKAIFITLGSFIILFFVISLFVTFVLRTKKLIELIKGNQKSKGEPKANIWLTLFAAILLIVGYSIALYVKGAEVIIAMIPVIVIVTVGTYFFFTQLSVYLIRRLKRSRPIFWRKTNMILFSDLAFRLKDNARTFFMVAMISTVAFTAIGTLFGFQSYITRSAADASPYPYTYSIIPGNDEPETENDLVQIDNYLKEKQIPNQKEGIQLHYFDVNGREVLIVKASDYNRFAKLANEELVHPKEKEAIVTKDQQANMVNENTEEILVKTKISLKDKQQINPSKIIETNILPEMYAYYIVNDNVYNQLPDAKRENMYFAWQVKNVSKDVKIETGKYLTEHTHYYNFQSIDYMLYEINKSFGPILFIGLFIGIVFFVSAGSFLYFRLYTDLDEDKVKFKAIAKMGLTDFELRKIITRQTIILFFAPIIVALLHGVVALTALSHFFDFDITREGAIVLGSFACIQVIYFILVRYFYLKQLKRALR